MEKFELSMKVALELYKRAKRMEKYPKLDDVKRGVYNALINTATKLAYDSFFYAFNHTNQYLILPKSVFERGGDTIVYMRGFEKGDFGIYFIDSKKYEIVKDSELGVVAKKRSNGKPMDYQTHIETILKYRDFHTMYCIYKAIKRYYKKQNKQ